MSAIYAIYAIAIFTVWLVDAKQDIEQIPMIDKYSATNNGIRSTIVQPMERTPSSKKLKFFGQEGNLFTLTFSSIRMFIFNNINRFTKVWADNVESFYCDGHSKVEASAHVVVCILSSSPRQLQPHTQDYCCILLLLLFLLSSFTPC